MDILYQLQKHQKNIVSVQKVGKIFLLFSANEIYVWGSEKEVKKFIDLAIK